MGNFSFCETGIEGLVLITPKVFADNRGFLMETYNQRDFREGGIVSDFVQDNQSKSSTGVLRGMHFQIKNPQGKLVRVVAGEVFDVAVDLREDSATYSKWFGVTLSAENKKQLFIPEGFAHGFYVISDAAEFVYKCTRFYDPSDEGGVRFDDKTIGIEWPFGGREPIVSSKDLALPFLNNAGPVSEER